MRECLAHLLTSTNNQERQLILSQTSVPGHQCLFYQTVKLTLQFIRILLILSLLAFLDIITSMLNNFLQKMMDPTLN